jgi:hypothetical protein
LRAFKSWLTTSQISLKQAIDQDCKVGDALVDFAAASGALVDKAIQRSGRILLGRFEF